MKKILLLTSTMFFALFVFGQKLPFQGKLIESGTPVNGTRSIEVGLPGLSWSETHAGVQITDGLYFIVLGSITPLPANLFTDIDERQLTLSVDGTALSPVTLYKPLAGKLDSLYLKSPGNGLLHAGFGTGSALNENWPAFRMKGNLEGDRLSLNVFGNNEGTYESAWLNLNSTSGNIINLNPGWSTFSSTLDSLSLSMANQGIFLFQNNKFYGQYITHNWGNTGYSGLISLNGPNSMNFQIGSRWWDNPDLPWFDLRGTSDQGIIQLISTLDENESGIINILSKNGKSGQLTTDFLGLNANGKRTASVETQGYGDSKQKGVVILEDSDGNKSSFTPHHLTVNGPNWEEFVMIKGTNEGDNTHGGYITLTGQDGQFTNLRPGGLSSSGSFYIGNGTLVDGNLHVTGNITYDGYISPSDERLKQDIQPLENNILGKMKSIGGYSYFWRTDEYPDKHFSADKQIGLIAQQLEAQFPTLVKTNDDGFKSVNYNGFTAVLLQAVKELNVKVEKLESENQKLYAELSASASNRTEIEQLKSQMEILTKLVMENSTIPSGLSSAETVSTAGLK